MRNVSDVSDNVSDSPLVDSTVKDETRLLKLLKENPKITYKELSLELGVVRRTVQRRIQKLKEAGKLRRSGTEKTGYWEITGR
jgi:ATP-dependent DNA helicase RecG